MNEGIGITGIGAVSPAGWGINPLNHAINDGATLDVEPFEGASHCRRRSVPKPTEKLPFLRNPRLRRASPVGKFLGAAAIEALGDRRPQRLAIVVSCYTGSVNYSSRFYGEVLADPATASPIVFPETVFNAPSSHLSALFGTDLVNHTLVGDESAFATALDLAARWLVDDKADAVLVAAGEESDPLTAEALALHVDEPIVGEGAAALLLQRSVSPEIEIVEITDPITYTHRCRKSDAVAQLGDPGPAPTPDRIIAALGDCFGATPALAMAFVAANLSEGQSETVPIIGKNQAAASVTLKKHR